MSNDVFTQLFENVGSVPKSVININKLAVTNLEKLAEFQLNAMQSCVDIWLNQLKAAIEIDDVDGLRKFYDQQVEVANGFRQKMMDDAKALVDLGTEFKSDFAKLANESVPEVAPKAA